MSSSANRRALASFIAGTLLVGMGLISTGVSAAGRAPIRSTPVIQAVGAENEYANVIQQIGGAYVHAVGIMRNPNIDPHTFEASPVDAQLVGEARLIVQNGLGYDTFMNRLEKASPNPKRVVITASAVIGMSQPSKNPHIFYQPGAMAKVAARIAATLTRMQPGHRQYFMDHLKAFNRALRPWNEAIRRLRQAYRNTKVAVTEPVADYLLNAAGLRTLTPWAFQAAIMNGTDPSPQAAQAERNLLLEHKVRVFVYNQQAVDSTTQTLLTLAKRERIPVVGVYETMPPKHSYQTWMLDETLNLYRALRYHRSFARM